MHNNFNGCKDFVYYSVTMIFVSFNIISINMYINELYQTYIVRSNRYSFELNSVFIVFYLLQI